MTGVVQKLLYSNFNNEYHVLVLHSPRYDLLLSWLLSTTCHNSWTGRGVSVIAGAKTKWGRGVGVGVGQGVLADPAAYLPRYVVAYERDCVLSWESTVKPVCSSQSRDMVKVTFGDRWLLNTGQSTITKCKMNVRSHKIMTSKKEGDCVKEMSTNTYLILIWERNLMQTLVIALP